jgi:peptidyl-prolyl cis-trans isomerase C
MKADLVIISSVILAVLLFCLGCEPESGSAAQKAESPPAELSAAAQAPQQQSEQAQVETEMMTEQPAQPSQEKAEQAEAETEMMMKKPAGTETEMMPEQPVKPETEMAAEQPAESQLATEPQTKAVEQAPQPSPDDIVVTVNGTAVKRERLDKYLEPQLQRIAASRKLTDEQLAVIKDRLVRRLTQVLVIETLIDQQMKERNIVVAPQQIDDRIAEMAARENLTVDDLKAIVTRNGGTFEQWKERMQFDKIIGILKLAELEGLGTGDVNDADALAYYQQNQDSYKIPEMVRASHILITPEKGPDIDPNAADSAAKEKAEQLLGQIKAGADFAQLAKENSDCPSASKGGDLGFQRREAWVKPFSDAAFALQPGQISDIVKTRFGYHIIKVTDRKEPTEIPFDNVKESIVHTLETQKESDLSNKCIELLRSKAQIVYAEGYGPEQTEDTMPQ